MVIVCGEYNIDVKPETVSNETEVVLTITRIVNHPNFKANNDQDEEVRGQYLGNDIAIYHVDDSKLRSAMTRGKLWPACLPKTTYATDRGEFAGWLDPEPYYRIDGDTDIDVYRENYLFTRKVQVEEVPCRDPGWMNSNTYYPQGTVCYRDPSVASCFLFGNSGSGVMRSFINNDGVLRESWVGPLSMSKGCDLALILDFEITYAAENAGVFTNALCFLPWIAAQYGKRMPNGFKVPTSCTQSSGDKKDLNKTSCRASGDYLRDPKVNLATRFSYCDFTQKDDEGKLWDRCRLFANEGFAYNLYECRDRFGQNVICANNCRGVDPNAILAGGSAIFFTAAFGGLGALAPVIVPALGLAAAGGAAMAVGGPAFPLLGICPPGTCRVGNQCCGLQLVSGQLRCPTNC